MAPRGVTQSRSRAWRVRTKTHCNPKRTCLCWPPSADHDCRPRNHCGFRQGCPRVKPQLDSELTGTCCCRGSTLPDPGGGETASESARGPEPIRLSPGRGLGAMCVLAPQTRTGSPAPRETHSPILGMTNDQKINL